MVERTECCIFPRHAGEDIGRAARRGAARRGAASLPIFDETFNGLDPFAACEAKPIVKELAASGAGAFVIATNSVEAVPRFAIARPSSSRGPM